MRQFYVYILSSRSGVLYVGVTNDLERRVWEHKTKALPGFTSKYNCDRLVFYESFPDSWSAIEAEKRIKGWRREKKVKLIEEANPTWRDLSDGWYDDLPRPPRTTTPCHPEGSGSDPRDLGATTRAAPSRDPSVA
jgi:putative endonuclease